MRGRLAARLAVATPALLLAAGIARAVVPLAGSGLGAFVSTLQPGRTRFGHVAFLLPAGDGSDRLVRHLRALPLDPDSGFFGRGEKVSEVAVGAAAWDAAPAVDLAAGYPDRLARGALLRSVSRGDLAPAAGRVAFFPGRAGFASRPGQPAGPLLEVRASAPSASPFGPPLVVAWPNDPGFFLSDLHGYARFAAEGRSRRRLVLSAAGDGTVHAFDGGPSDGEGPGSGAELFAYRPGGAVVPSATGFAAGVPPLQLGDVFVDAPWAPAGRPCPDGGGRSCQWRTVVTGGLGPLGRTVFALDVTRADPGHAGSDAPGCLASGSSSPSPGCRGPFPALLFEFGDTADADRDGKPDLTFTYSPPVLGRTRLSLPAGTEPRDRFVAFFGGGLDPAERLASSGRARPSGRSGAWLYVLDAGSGRLLAKLDRGVVHGAPGAAPVPRRLAAVPSPVAAVDLDLDGTLDVVYFGDLSGQLWRLPLTPSAPGYDPLHPLVPGLLFDGTLEPDGRRPCAATEGGTRYLACGAERAVLHPPAVLRLGTDPRNGRPRYLVAWATGFPAGAGEDGGPEGGRVLCVLDDGGRTVTPAMLERIPSPTAPLAGSCDREGRTSPAGWSLDLLPGERPASAVLALAGELYLLAGRSSAGAGSATRLYRLLAANGDPCRGAACCATSPGFWGDPRRPADRGRTLGDGDSLWHVLLPVPDGTDRPHVGVLGLSAARGAVQLLGTAFPVAAAPRLRAIRER